MQAISRPSWRGLGARRIDVDDGDDVPVLDALSRVLGVATPSQRRALLAMVATMGSRLSGATRVDAYDGRKRALSRGIVLPPWWRLRLAVRRTGWKDGKGMGASESGSE